jgi:hypothetical protein
MCRIPRRPEKRVDREYTPRSTGAGAASRRVSGNARHETEDRTGTASVRDRADDVRTGPRRAREDELSVPEIRRDVRSVDGRQFASPRPGEGGGDVDTDRDDIAPREPGSMRREPDLVSSPTGEPGRLERRRIPPCPQCDATNAQRVLTVAPESRLRWFRCRGCGHLWNVAPPISSPP